MWRGVTVRPSASVCLPRAVHLLKITQSFKLVKVKRYSSLWGTHLKPMLPYGITQCYLPPDTGERNAPCLTPARKAGTRFTYSGGMEGWVDLGGWLHTEMVHPSTEGLPIQLLTGPDVEQRYVDQDQRVTAKPGQSSERKAKFLVIKRVSLPWHWRIRRRSKGGIFISDQWC